MSVCVSVCLSPNSRPLIGQTTRHIVEDLDEREASNLNKTFFVIILELICVMPHSGFLIKQIEIMNIQIWLLINRIEVCNIQVIPNT